MQVLWVRSLDWEILWEGNSNPLQYSCLENSMDRGAWQATVHGIANSWATNTSVCYWKGVVRRDILAFFILVEKQLVVLPLSMILTVVFFVCGYSLSSWGIFLLLLVYGEFFYHVYTQNFVKCFFWIYWYDYVIFKIIVFIFGCASLHCCVGFSLVMASGAALYLQWWTSHCLGFSCCRAWSLGHRSFSRCSSWAHQLQLLGSRAQA